MPVQLNQPGKLTSFPLTSPLEEVKKNLGEDWIASLYYYGDRQIVITVPFPDTIRLTGDLLNEDLDVPDHSGKSVFAVYHELDLALLQFIASFPADPSNGIEAEKQTKYELNVLLKDGGEHLGWASLRRRKGKDFGVWSFTLQFSPFKVGSERLPMLIDRLEDAFCMFDIVKLISRLPVSRCDVAIDMYGLRPFDLVLSMNGAGKSCVWENKDHHETLYLYAPKAYPIQKPKHGSYKARGPLLARVYDRSAHAKWHKLPETAGGIPVTRFEVPRAWKSYRPSLALLKNVNNMLEGLGAGFAWPGDLGTNERWRRIHRARFPIRPKWSELGFPVAEGIKLNQLYDNFPKDLVSANSWSRWSDGLSLTGINTLT
ncbi:hypothetical protein [Qipengyuania sp. NPDC077563]|uniref:hypothetical protein n=1 Tax=Qipengyuania sp. NPDC077563 TaxID=3364497 RepID=UPI00384FFADD